KDLLAPVVLKEDEQLLAASPLLLEFLLETTRTTGSHAASVAKLKGKVTSKLKDGFQKAVQRQIDEGTLPQTVGMVMMKMAKTLQLERRRRPARHKSGRARRRYSGGWDALTVRIPEVVARDRRCSSWMISLPVCFRRIPSPTIA